MYIFSRISAVVNSDRWAIRLMTRWAIAAAVFWLLLALYIVGNETIGLPTPDDF